MLLWVKFLFEGEIMIVEKIDDNTIEIATVVPESINTVRFDRRVLEQRKKDIEAYRDNFLASIAKDLAEVNGYLAECDKLGVIIKVEEPVIIEEPVIEEPTVPIPDEEPIVEPVEEP